MADVLENTPRRTPFAGLIVIALSGGCSGVEGETGGSEGSTGAPMVTQIRMSSLTDYRPLKAAMLTVNEDPMAELDLLNIRHIDGDYVGEYDGKAWIVFDGVPEGTYELHWRYALDPEQPDVPRPLVVMESDLGDLYTDRVYSGRPEVELATNAATGLRLSVDNMTPLGDLDRFEVYSHNVDALGELSPYEDPGAGPLFGDTSITGWAVPWEVGSTRGRNPLVDPGAGDDLWITHQRGAYLDVQDPFDPWYDSSVYTLLEAAPLDLQAMVDGVMTDTSGSFATTPLKSLNIDLRTSEFLAEAAPSVPSPEVVECSATVSLEPGTELPVYGLLPTLGEVRSVSYTALSDRVLSFDYGNPFPVGTETLFVRCMHWQPLAHPSEGDSDYVFAFVDAAWPVAELDGGPLRPRIGSVRQVKVDGSPAPVDTIRMGVGSTPTLSFEAPEVGVADLYSVRIFTVDNVLAEDESVAQSRRQVLSFATTNTSITVPEGVLEPGAFYYAQLAASTGQKLGTGRPYSHSSGVATATTGLFTP